MTKTLTEKRKIYYPLFCPEDGSLLVHLFVYSPSRSGQTLKILHKISLTNLIPGKNSEERFKSISANFNFRNSMQNKIRDELF